MSRLGGTCFYFAYGSNLHPERLTRRVPSAEPVGMTVLPAHQLRWHKRGNPCGSGKCNVVPHRGGSGVLGVVYRMPLSERPALDAAEGVGKGYTIGWFKPPDLTLPDAAFYYRAQPPHVDDALAPFDWYRDLVHAGASYHRFPDDYIAGIAATEAMADPDPVRREMHHQLVAEILARR